VTLRALGGNAAARTLVLLDGVPMADPMFGSVALSAIAPERLGAIRVTRGGGSGAFGRAPWRAPSPWKAPGATPWVPSPPTWRSTIGARPRFRPPPRPNWGKVSPSSRVAGTGDRVSGPRLSTSASPPVSAPPMTGGACRPAASPPSPPTSNSRPASWPSATSGPCALPGLTAAALARMPRSASSRAGHGRSMRWPMCRIAAFPMW
jgi:hypothetical protein